MSRRLEMPVKSGPAAEADVEGRDHNGQHGRDDQGVERVEEGTDAQQPRDPQVDPAEMSQGEFAYGLHLAVEQAEARVVVIDSLDGYLNALPDRDLLAVQMHELLTYLDQRGVLTLLVVAQHGLVGDALASPADLSYLADAILLLRYFEAGGYSRFKLGARVLACELHEWFAARIRRELMARAERALEENVLLSQVALLERVPDLDFQLVDVERLTEIIMRAEPHRFDGGVG